MDVQHGVGGTNVTGYRLSTGSSMSAINLLSPRGDHHRDGGMNKVDSQLRRSSQLLSAVRVPNVHADLAAKPPSQKQRNGADLPKVPAFRRIRQLLLPSGNRTPLAIWIMPAQCTEVNISWLWLTSIACCIADSGDLNQGSKSTDTPSW